MEKEGSSKFEDFMVWRNEKWHDESNSRCGLFYWSSNHRIQGKSWSIDTALVTYMATVNWFENGQVDFILCLLSNLWNINLVTQLKNATLFPRYSFIFKNLTDLEIGRSSSDWQLQKSCDRNCHQWWGKVISFEKSCGRKRNNAELLQRRSRQSLERVDWFEFKRDWHCISEVHLNTKMKSNIYKFIL